MEPIREINNSKFIYFCDVHILVVTVAVAKLSLEVWRERAHSSQHWHRSHGAECTTLE